MNVSRFDIKTLALFVEICRSGSISAGAKVSHLALGAASKRISDLEQTLGTTLFFRNSTGVELTEAGNVCLTYALKVLDNLDRMFANMSDYADGVKGRIRIAANTSSLTQFLPEDLAAFMRDQSMVQIDLEELNSGDVVSALLENRADIGIFADRTESYDLEVVPYRSDELVLIIPHRHPLARISKISFRETLDFPYVGLPISTSIATRLSQESEKIGRKIQLQVQVRSFDAICKMVAATGGIGILPRFAAEPHARSMSIKLITLTDVWAHRILFVGTRSKSTLSAASRALLAHLTDR